LAAPFVEPVSMTALKTSMCRKRTCFLRSNANINSGVRCAVNPTTSL
jgi:hypothetical protein